MRAYNWVVKSPKSMLSASPELNSRSEVGKKKGGRGLEGTKEGSEDGRDARSRLTGPGGRYAPCPESSSYAVTMQES